MVCHHLHPERSTERHAHADSLRKRFPYHRASCGWRIVIPPKIPEDSPSCYHSSMRNLAVLFIHFIAVLARLLGPGGVRSIVAESLLLKHQLLIVNRSRQRSPNLSASDRIFAGWMALLVRPTRLLRSAIALKPSTLLVVRFLNSIAIPAVVPYAIAIPRLGGHWRCPLSVDVPG